MLAGVGALANHAVSWTSEEKQFTREHLVAVLGQVHWEREERYWEGVAAKSTASGELSFAGGVKDSGHRVHDALLNEDSDLGKRIGGRA